MSKIPSWLLLLAAVGCADDPTTPSPGDTALPVVDLDSDGFAAPDDCDDTDPSVHPGATELCDGFDSNCVEGDEPLQPYYVDADGDGVGGEFAESCEVPPDSASAGGDCDDFDPDAFPGAPQLCDGRDNTCGAYVRDEWGLHTTGLDRGAWTDAAEFATTSVTFAAWVRVDDVSRPNPIMYKPAITHGGHGAYSLDLFEGVLSSRFETEYYEFIDIASADLGISSGEWFHVAVSYDEATGEAAIWYDGGKVASAFGATGGLYYGCERTPLTLGHGTYHNDFCGEYATATLSNPAAMALDEVVIYGRALDEAEMEGLAAGTLAAGALAYWPFTDLGAGIAYDSTSTHALTLEAGVDVAHTCPLL